MSDKDGLSPADAEGFRLLLIGAARFNLHFAAIDGDPLPVAEMIDQGGSPDGLHREPRTVLHAHVAIIDGDETVLLKSQPPYVNQRFARTHAKALGELSAGRHALESRHTDIETARLLGPGVEE